MTQTSIASKSSGWIAKNGDIDISASLHLVWLNTARKPGLAESSDKVYIAKPAIASLKRCLCHEKVHYCTHIDAPHVLAIRHVVNPGRQFDKVEDDDGESKRKLS